MLVEAFRMVLRHVRTGFKGFNRYDGSVEEICKKIVHDCWNGTYFQTSTGHFKSFFTRDFGWCVPSLMVLGYKKEIHKTLEWVFECFSRKGCITTTITSAGRPFDFPVLGIDSLAFLLFAINESGFNFSKYEYFLRAEVEQYYAACVGSDGLPKKGHFSSMKDHAVREQSCYDVVMFGWISLLLDKLGLDNPFGKNDHEKILMKYYWAGSYFRDDLSRREYVAGDANVLPFWTGLIKNKNICKMAIAAIERAGLVSPFPLKYTVGKPEHKQILAACLASNYEGTAVWAHLGMLYLDVLKKNNVGLFKKHLQSYVSLVKKYGTFLEVYNPDGSPYKTWLYTADEGMLWASMLVVFNLNYANNSDI